MGLGFGIYFLAQPGDFIISRGFPVSKIFIGVVFLCMSFFSLYLYIFKHPSSSEREGFICIHCKRPFLPGEVNGPSCPKCNGQIENLKGIIERHPELFNDIKKRT